MSHQKICPYPGLRPFTEKESIFFKGRDVHIGQVIAQLEEKKFVMLTGASGDGKSSLVYAGVIPEARAGFFKAKFNNWIIADFRPERTPLKNMGFALRSQLELDPDEVSKELNYGFSALVNLYKSTPYHLDYNSDVWKKADEDTKKTLKSKAANLFILVDQFEEFFTNPENYSHGKPSKQSQTVVNIILETAKIALEQDLPIYIICTMRSDYIGQCAAFRGLPEYIGFSQFFVPRLSRKEIYQVIEEPALLSGNTISQRLVEVLINEMSEGFDQLPVLQHTLNRVWNTADQGKVEMDLIHLAKLAGIPSDYLPEKDQLQFKEWKKTLPEFKKKYLKEPSLSKVLAAHANELYETDHKTGMVSQEDAKLIIKTAFQCLTKMDEDRAVRNRMTLQEITDILNQPHINTKTVGGVLNIFREQGNTFINPFVTDTPESKDLQTATVLDITHESLIRNWDLLRTWAEEDYRNWQNFQDFNKQLQRWVDSGKSGGYLLPIGPLTFFESWYKTCKPNKHWFARYDEREMPVEEKLKDAEETLNNAKEFIKRSARKLFVSRTVMKYGANRIAAAFAILALLITCTYYYYDYYIKWNDYVIEDIIQKGTTLLTSNKIKTKNKAHFLVNCERLNPGSFKEILNGLADSLAFDIAVRTFRSVENYKDPDRQEINAMAKPLFNYLDRLLNQMLNRNLRAGIIRNEGGRKIYTIDDKGIIRDRWRQYGKVEQSGIIIDESGVQIGTFERNGNITTKSGKKLGTFESKGISENNLRNINRFLTACYFMKTHEPGYSIEKSIDRNLGVLFNSIKRKLNWEKDSITYNQAVKYYDQAVERHYNELKRWEANLIKTRPIRPDRPVKHKNWEEDSVTYDQALKHYDQAVEHYYNEHKRWEANLRKTKPIRSNIPVKPKKSDFKGDLIIRNVASFNQSIEILLAYSDKRGKNKVAELVKMVSPFEGDKNKQRFDKIYPKDKRWKSSWNDYLTHNGGYQILAYLYAIEGDIDKIGMCLDSITTYNKDYKKYRNENFYMIFNYLTKFDYFPSVFTEALIKKYQDYSGLTRLKIIEKICKRNFSSKMSSGYIKGGSKNTYFSNFIHYLISAEQKNSGWDYYGNAIQKKMADFAGLSASMTKSFRDEWNFNFAMYYKKRGISTVKGVSKSQIESDQFLSNKVSDKYFKRAFEHYSKISDDFLNQDFVIGWTEDPRSKRVKHSELFLYPAIIDEENTYNPYRVRSSQENPFPFFDFVLKNKEYYDFYKTKEDFETLERFLYEYYKTNKIDSWSKRDNINYDYFSNVWRKAIRSHMKEVINTDFFDLLTMIKHYDRKGEPGYYKNYKNFLAADFQNQEDPKGEVHKELLKSLAVHLAENNRLKESREVLNAFTEDHYRRNTTIDVVYALQEKGPVENSFIYLDTLFSEIDRENKFGVKLIRVLGMIGSQPLYDLSLKLIKDVNESYKSRAMINFIRGVAYNGFYYKAFKYIPDYISSNKELELYNEILHAEVISQMKEQSPKKTGWEKYDRNTYGDDQWPFLDYESELSGVTVVYSMSDD